VTIEMLEAWGGLCRKNREPLKDGYIQLSGNPPLFTDPDRFIECFAARSQSLFTPTMWQPATCNCS
jgi:hypothetical protein